MPRPPHNRPLICTSDNMTKYNLDSRESHWFSVYKATGLYTGSSPQVNRFIYRWWCQDWTHFGHFCPICMIRFPWNSLWFMPVSRFVSQHKSPPLTPQHSGLFLGVKGNVVSAAPGMSHHGVTPLNQSLHCEMSRRQTSPWVVGRRQASEFPLQTSGNLGRARSRLLDWLIIQFGADVSCEPGLRVLEYFNKRIWN